MRHIFLDFDRTLFDTESFYNSLEITYIEGIISGAIGADLTKFLYPDAVSFLQYCRNADYSCHLLTFGRRNIQECKFKLTNIETYFDQLFYVEQGSKAEVIKNYLESYVSCEKAIFIDDTIGHLEDFARLMPGRTPIRMRRPGAKGSDVVDDRFKTCSNLQECSALLS